MKDAFYEPSFGHLGRVRVLDEKWADERTRLRQPFTALGYGTEAYAAAYPHCRNVFGFYDPCFASGKAADGLSARHCYLTYLVVGWYSDTASDPITLVQAAAQELFLAELKKTGPGDLDLADLANDALAQAIAVEYRWAYEARDQAHVPGLRVLNEPARRRPERCFFVGQLTHIEWPPTEGCSRVARTIRPYLFAAFLSSPCALRVEAASSPSGSVRCVSMTCQPPQFSSGHPHGTALTGCRLSPSRF
jgi:hypothetical protein